MTFVLKKGAAGWLKRSDVNRPGSRRDRDQFEIPLDRDLTTVNRVRLVRLVVVA
jgi:hypothetical protein